MRRKLRRLALTLSLSCFATALCATLSASPAMSVPLAAAKSLGADEDQIVLARVARGGRGAVRRGGAYRGRAVVRGGTVVRRGAVVTGGGYSSGSCDPNYEDCGGVAVYRGGAVVRRGAAVRGGVAVRGRGAHVAHRGGRGRR
jgi:hypothetical protein